MAREEINSGPQTPAPEPRRPLDERAANHTVREGRDDRFYRCEDDADQALRAVADAPGLQHKPGGSNVRGTNAWADLWHIQFRAAVNDAATDTMVKNVTRTYPGRHARADPENVDCPSSQRAAQARPAALRCSNSSALNLLVTPRAFIPSSLPIMWMCMFL
jgi:hypothetical protein